VAPRRNLARRPASLRCIRAVCGLTAGCVAFTAACSSATSRRPATTATLQIVAPAPNAVTSPNVTVKLRLEHAALIPPAQVGGKIRPDRGHIHVSVDGALVSMALELDQSIRALAPGVHTIQAEFVASDHLPFANRVVAAVTFRVA
jgi:hypothetical protein